MANMHIEMETFLLKIIGAISAQMLHATTGPQMSNCCEIAEEIVCINSAIENDA